MSFDWSAYQPPKPQQLGVQKVCPSLEELVAYIDWTPFFMTGSWPVAIQRFSRTRSLASCTQLFADAQERLQWLIDDGRLDAQGVYGFWPANRFGTDDIEIFADDSRSNRLCTLHHLRQQAPKPTTLVLTTA